MVAPIRCGRRGGRAVIGPAPPLSRAIAERIEVPAEVVDELVDIYRQEQELKSRRIALVFPAGIAAAAQSARAG